MTRLPSRRALVSLGAIGASAFSAQQLTDVFPEARDLLYHFLDAPAVMTKDALSTVFDSAGMNQNVYEQVLDFLLYYGVLGVRLGDHDYFIYAENYDLKMLKIRAERAKGEARYLLNPAFWPTFGIDEGVVARAQAETG